jgi:hypothetical protein
MILFKDSKQRSSIRQGNQPNGRILESVEGGSLIYAIRKDDIGPLCKASLDYSALEVNNTGHLKVHTNHITTRSSNGSPIVEALTTNILAALQPIFFYRLYNLYMSETMGVVEKAGWSFQSIEDSGASQKWIRNYQSNDLYINLNPGYIDLQAGTGLDIITANGSAKLEWSVGYSLIRWE